MIPLTSEPKNPPKSQKSNTHVFKYSFDPFKPSKPNYPIPAKRSPNHQNLKTRNLNYNPKYPNFQLHLQKILRIAKISRLESKNPPLNFPKYSSTQIKRKPKPVLIQFDGKKSIITISSPSSNSPPPSRSIARSTKGASNPNAFAEEDQATSIWPEGQDPLFSSPLHTDTRYSRGGTREAGEQENILYTQRALPGVS